MSSFRLLLLVSAITLCFVTLSTATSLAEQEWIHFRKWHVLDPADFPKYTSWKARSWTRWFLQRRSDCIDMKDNPVPWPSGLQLRHHNSRVNRTAILKCLKHTEVVIVANPEEILSAFSGTLTQYGVEKQAMVWSSKPFQAFVFLKAGTRLFVYDCGSVYIAGRLLDKFPITLHDFYPEIIRNSFGGHLRYAVRSHCTHILH